MPDGSGLPYRIERAQPRIHGRHSIFRGKTKADEERLAEAGDELREAVNAMPGWAVESHCRAFRVERPFDTRVSVADKVERDRLTVETWSSKRRGAPIHRVRRIDGRVTVHEGDLPRCYVAWDR